MQTIALVSALLLTVVIAIPMSVARDELDAVGYMYTRFGPLGCQLGFEWDVLKKLAEFSSDSISYFTVSLLVSVLQLMIMSTLPSELANDAEEKMAAFWDIQKYLTLFSVFTVLAGLYNFANVTIYVYSALLPAYTFHHPPHATVPHVRRRNISSSFFGCPSKVRKITMQRVSEPFLPFFTYPASDNVGPLPCSILSSQLLTTWVLCHAPSSPRSF